MNWKNFSELTELKPKNYDNKTMKATRLKIKNVGLISDMTIDINKPLSILLTAPRRRKRPFSQLSLGSGPRRFLRTSVSLSWKEAKFEI